MKKKLLISLVGLCLAGTAHAQDSLQVKPQVSAPYKVAVGIRLSPGGPAYDISFTAKYFIGKESALEAQASRLSYRGAYLGSLSYVWQPQLLTSQRFRPYAGIGVGVMRTVNYYPEGDLVKVNPVGVATAGIEYNFRRLPLAISLDYRSTFVRFDNSSTQVRLGLEQTSNLGLGLKYTFR